MMVLTAVILLAAFMALTAMVARVNTLPLETDRERTDPFATEFGAIHRSLDRAAVRLDDTTLLNGNDYVDSLQDAFDAIERLHASRGYMVEATVTCSGPSGTPPSQITITLQVQDARTYAQASWTYDTAEATCS